MTKHQRELFNNGSGHPDPTAYMAITRADEAMIRPGDIYRIDPDYAGGADRFALVVAIDEEGYVSTLLLTEAKYNKGRFAEFEIPKIGRMYVNPYRIRSAKGHNLAEYVCIMGDEDFEVVKDSIRQAFQIPQVEQPASSPTPDTGQEDIHQKALAEVYDLLVEQAKRPQAMWIKNRNCRRDIWRCSNCGEETESTCLGEPRYKTCPMCDAKIIGYREEDAL